MVLERLIDATYSRRRTAHLAGANLGFGEASLLAAAGVRSSRHRPATVRARGHEASTRPGAGSGPGERRIMARKAREICLTASLRSGALHAAALRAARGKAEQARGGGVSGESRNRGAATGTGSCNRAGTGRAAIGRSRSSIPGIVSSPRPRFATGWCIMHGARSASRSLERGFIHDSHANRSRQGHSPGRGALRAVPRPLPVRAAGRYFPILPARSITRYSSGTCAEGSDASALWRSPTGSWTVPTGRNRWTCRSPGDDLLTPLQRRRGLPIGNLTSQLFANVYLNPLDHYCKQVAAGEGLSSLRR